MEYKALKQLCSIYEIHIEESVAFGDDTNHLGLFTVCGRSIALDNAIQDLKDIATEVTASNDHDGVAVVVERLSR